MTYIAVGNGGMGAIARGQVTCVHGAIVVVFALTIAGAHTQAGTERTAAHDGANVLTGAVATLRARPRAIGIGRTVLRHLPVSRSHEQEAYPSQMKKVELHSHAFLNASAPFSMNKHAFQNPNKASVLNLIQQNASII